MKKHKNDSFTYKVSANDFKKHYQLVTSKEQITEHYHHDIDGRTDLQIVKTVLDSGKIIYWTGKGWEPDINKAAKMPYARAEKMIEDMYAGSLLKPMIREKYKITKENI